MQLYTFNIHLNPSSFFIQLEHADFCTFYNLLNNIFRFVFDDNDHLYTIPSTFHLDPLILIFNLNMIETIKCITNTVRTT